MITVKISQVLSDALVDVKKYYKHTQLSEQMPIFVDDSSKSQHMQLVYSYCGNVVKQLSCNMHIMFLAFVNFILVCYIN